MPKFVDRDSPRAEWRTIHRVADGTYPVVHTRVSAALNAVRRKTPWQDVLARLEQFDHDGAASLVAVDAMERSLTKRVVPPLGRAFAKTFRMTEERVLLLQKDADDAFRRTNPFAIEWAETEAALMVTRVTEETRRAVQSTIAEGFRAQQEPRVVMSNLRTLVGLTDREATRIMQMAILLSQDGMSTSRVKARMRKERERSIRLRAENIARTETMSASNYGQLNAWRDARSRGQLRSDLVKQIIVTPDDRLCPICAPLDGDTAQIDESFSFGLVPPIHPRCRCTVGLVRADSIAA